MSLFQSTLPVRGATDSSYSLYLTSFISIHAPREGSDVMCRVRRLARQRFQSTLPVRGATAEDMEFTFCVFISIHAPREGSDDNLIDSIVGFEISIHAPREGSDHFTYLQRGGQINFNPRSP